MPPTTFNQFKLEKTVNIITRSVFRLFILIGLWLAFSPPQTGETFPLDDPFSSKENLSQHSAPFPRNDMNTPVYRSLQPLLNDQYNEPHPFPESIQKTDKDEKLPEYYRQLLLATPEDQVQSKIFDVKTFKEMKKIGVMGFENKTYAPHTNAIAGEVVTNQAFSEMRATNYTVISPPEMNEMIYRMKIVATPSTKKPTGQKSKKDSAGATAMPETAKLPFTDKDMDGVLVGAVTKFIDSYTNEHGETEKSIASGVEFGAYLISTKTGNVVWGARYISSQPVNLINTLTGENRVWLDKEELSRKGMKKVLKVFYNTQGQNQGLPPLTGK